MKLEHGKQEAILEGSYFNEKLPLGNISEKGGSPKLVRRRSGSPCEEERKKTGQKTWRLPVPDGTGVDMDESPPSIIPHPTQSKIYRGASNSRESNAGNCEVHCLS